MNEVNKYLSNVPQPQRAELVRVRAVVKRLVPGAQESISYMMPAFTYKNKPLVYYAAFKNHLSIFPTSGPIEYLQNDLTGFKITKGTIQFTLQKPLPETLIQKIVLARKHEIDGK